MHTDRHADGAGHIADFSRPQGDKIDLRDIDANAQAGGNQAFKFIGDAPFTAVGQLQFYHVNGDTFIEANTTDATAGRGAADRARWPAEPAGRRLLPVAATVTFHRGRLPMSTTASGGHCALPLAGLLAALAASAALAPAIARANDRDLRGTPVPAAACIEYRRTGPIEDPWKAGYFGLTGDGQYLQLRCPFPVNNIDLSGTTDDNDLSKMRVHYRDSDAFGDGAGVGVVLLPDVRERFGQCAEPAGVLLGLERPRDGCHDRRQSDRACAHDLAADRSTMSTYSWGWSPANRAVPRRRLPAVGAPARAARLRRRGASNN